MPFSATSGVNKCIINGRTVYTDKQCSDNTSQTFIINTTQPKPASTGAVEQEPATTKDAEYNNGRWYEDHAGYREALQISAASKAPILIYGHADWCPYCKKLNRTFLVDRDVNEVLAKFVKVKLNPEHSSQDERLFKRWGGTGYPTLFVQMNEATKPKKIKRPFVKQNDIWKMVSKEDFIATLQAQLDRYHNGKN